MDGSGLVRPLKGTPIGRYGANFILDLDRLCHVNAVQTLIFLKIVQILCSKNKINIGHELETFSVIFRSSFEKQTIYFSQTAKLQAIS